jgi:hypothetical protein
VPERVGHRGQIPLVGICERGRVAQWIDHRERLAVGIIRDPCLQTLPLRLEVLLGVSDGDEIAGAIILEACPEPVEGVVVL